MVSETQGVGLHRTRFPNPPVADTALSARGPRKRARKQGQLRKSGYAPADDHIFVSLHRKPLLGRDVITAFHAAAKRAGLPDRCGRARPTPKSLRHTFATRSLHTCPDGRDAITRHMVALSTYLGHKSVAETYWYLEAVPELMRDIADRAECLATGGQR